MTLTELLDNVRDQVRVLPPSAPELPGVMGRLEEIRAVAQQRMLAPAPTPAAAPALDRLLTIPEAAERLGISKWTVEEKCRRREIPAVRIGRLWRIAEKDIAAIIEGLRVGARRR